LTAGDNFAFAILQTARKVIASQKNSQSHKKTPEQLKDFFPQITDNS
jgi:hypothetical protein